MGGASSSQQGQQQKMNFLGKHKNALLATVAVVSAGAGLNFWYKQTQAQLKADAEGHYAKGKELYKQFDGKRRQKNSGMAEEEVLQIAINAAEEFGRAIELNPTVHAYNNRANLYQILKRYSDAFADAQASIAMKKNSRGYLAAGNAAKALKKYKTARKAFAAALEQDDIENNAFVKAQAPKQIAMCEKLLAAAGDSSSPTNAADSKKGGARSNANIKIQTKNTTPRSSSKKVVYASGSPGVKLSSNAATPAVNAFAAKNGVSPISTPQQQRPTQRTPIAPHPASIQNSNVELQEGEISHPASLPDPEIQSTTLSSSSALFGEGHSGILVPPTANGDSV